jgi:hypothetical protein
MRNSINTKRNSIAIIFTILLVALLTPLSRAQKTNDVVSIYTDTNAVHNFRLALSFPKTTFTNGEPVTCQYGLTNISETPTIITPSYFEDNLHFLITNSSGLQITPHPWHYEFQPVGGPERVPPHSTELSYYGLVPISDYFIFTPGTYQVSVVRDAGYATTVMLTSSVVTITILPSPPPTATNGPRITTN